MADRDPVRAAGKRPHLAEAPILRKLHRSEIGGSDFFAAVEAQVNTAADAINEANSENARVALNQNEFKKRYDTLVGAYREAEARRQAVEEQIKEKKARKEKIDRFIRQVEEQSELITCFDPALWASMVQEVTVGEDGKLTFLLNGGTEIMV